MPTTDRYREILRRNWGYDDFRGIQREIIESIGDGHDTLGLMPTGGGKSITFQVPGLIKEGVCIVITPLIALMKDQVQHLRDQGIMATAIYSGMSKQEILIALENCILGDYKFLYVAPERLESELFQAKVAHMHISFITVDEAHCISQWGHDFRPSYRQIARIRKLVPQVPILALTASATPEVVEDIEKQLEFRSDCNTYRMSFARENLTYIVRGVEDKKRELVHILESVPGSAIVYTRNRKQTEELAEELSAQGISATCYHAGLQQLIKDERQEKWQHNEYRVMVATNAFGMGIDKPDVRLVLHIEIPDSPEAYFQEAGRAGRDGEQAYAVLLHEPGDTRKLLKHVGENYPEPDYIKEVYESMCFYLQMAMGDGAGVTREFDLQEFCYRFHFFPVEAHSALILLSRAGLFKLEEEEEVTSRVMFTLQRDELYKLHEGIANQDNIIRTLLRKYSGLFVDFAYINEFDIAHETGLTEDEVYHTLKSLSQRHILTYIPRKRTNYITFLTRRVEKEEIQLPPEVYLDRKKQYQRRIECMIEYISDHDRCHSRFLLNYFGEKHTHDCGKCDVCCSHEATPSEREQIQLHIRRQLALKGPLFPTEISMVGFHSDTYIQVMQEMNQEEELVVDEDGRIALPK